MFYIVDKNKKVIASCNVQPSLEDLATREESIVEHASDIPAGSAEFVGGNIQRKAAPQPSTKDVEMGKIYSRMFKNVAKELQAEGELTDPSLLNYKDKTQKDRPKNVTQ